MTELLPCPFCGGDADMNGWMSQEIDGSTRVGPACDECGASAESVEAWNTRTVTTYDAKIDRLTKQLVSAQQRVAVLEMVIREEMHPQECADDANKMIVEEIYNRMSPPALTDETSK